MPVAFLSANNGNKLYGTELYKQAFFTMFRSQAQVWNESRTLRNNLHMEVVVIAYGMH